MMNQGIFLPPQQCAKPYTVSQINEGIAYLIESGNNLVWLEAEISNCKRASNGHYYMRLKDKQSQIPAVMWRSTVAKHTFNPENGLAIAAIAQIRVYRKGGYYQLDIIKMQPAGIGAIYAALEKLKKRLVQEGLFDQAHKQDLPESINTVGVITAKTGAALQDILKVIDKRAPQTNVILRSVPVQGEKAPTEIIAAIEEMNTYGKIDCLIVGRGGGSLEDLWAFNDEQLVRAIVQSKMPIISAVGHEIDFTLADFAADVRAPTPSAAAEMIVTDRKENQRLYEEMVKRFSRASQFYFASLANRYQTCVRNPAFKKAYSIIRDSRQQLDMFQDAKNQRLIQILGNKQSHLTRLAAQLQALSPLAVLSRGYSVVSSETMVPIKNAKDIKKGDLVHIQFHQGQAKANITSINETE